MRTYPTFTHILPICGKKIRIRQFISEEEKVLLYAKESGELEDYFESMKQINQNCLMNKLDVTELTKADFLSLFLKIRSLSIGNVIEVTYNDKDDKTNYDFSIDIEKITIKFLKESKLPKELIINDNQKITLKYPKISIEKDQIKDCIDQVIEDGVNIDFDGATENEKNEFMEDLPVSITNELLKFSKKVPQLYHIISYKNNKQKERKIEIETLEDFFLLTMTGRSLKNYMHINYHFGKSMHWDISSIEKLSPFEKDSYLDMVISEEKKIK